MGRGSAVVGRALALVFLGVQRVRHPRPIHPRGLPLTGSVHWMPRNTRSGIRWIDDPAAGESQPLAGRLSRSIGLPAPLPDVIGLALRVQTPEGPADIELASTGSGVPLRFTLLLRSRPSPGVYGTLVPYESDQGRVMVRARSLGPRLPARLGELHRTLRRTAWWVELSHATPAGPWHPFALVDLRAAESPDAMRADAGRRLIPGARMPAWFEALRQPSYDAVQRGDR